VKLKPKGGVTVRDRGYDRMRRSMLDLGNEEVQVGIFPESGEHVLNKAIWNEFGTVNAPARPFATTAFVVHKDELIDFTQRQVGLALDGKKSVNDALNAIGIKGQAIMRKRIVEIDTPPNAPSTIAKKGSSNPLIDSDEMLREVNYKLVAK